MGLGAFVQELRERGADIALLSVKMGASVVMTWFGFSCERDRSPMCPVIGSLGNGVQARDNISMYSATSVFKSMQYPQTLATFGVLCIQWMFPDTSQSFLVSFVC